MAQKILLRRGGLANLNSGATIGVSKGEQLFASGTLANTNIENITFIANADGNNSFQAVGRLFTGTAAADSFDSRLNGLPYYHTDNQALYRLGTATALDLTGNLEGNTVSAMTITTLTGTNANLSGNITGSNLLLSGNANIDGNIVLGGNITIGDANTDNISLGGEFTSDLIPDADDTYAVGSSSRRWNLYGVDSVISGSFSGSFVGDGSGLTGVATSDTHIGNTNLSLTSHRTLELSGNNFTFDALDGEIFSVVADNNAAVVFQMDQGDFKIENLPNTETPVVLGYNTTTGLLSYYSTSSLTVNLDITDGVNSDTVDLVTDTLTFTNASTHGFSFTISDNQVSLNTPQDLRTTASPTFAGATAGNIQVGVTGDNEIDTTSGNLTLDSAGGTVTIDDNASVTGTLTVTSTTDLNSTVTVNGDITLDGSGAQNITKTGGNLAIGASSGNTTIESTVFNGNDVTIPGNLTVSGTTTTIDSTTVNIGDNIIVLNAAGTVADGGVQVVDTTGTAGTGSILWNATNDYWYAGVSGSTHYRVSTFTNASPTTNAIPKVDSNKRLVASNIADTGTEVDISVDLDLNGNDLLNVNSIEIDGLAANSFIHTNGSKVLTAITPSTAGDIIQWNGSAFAASNVIDGGTF